MPHQRGGGAECVVVDNHQLSHALGHPGANFQGVCFNTRRTARFGRPKGDASRRAQTLESLQKHENAYYLCTLCRTFCFSRASAGMSTDESRTIHALSPTRYGVRGSRANRTQPAWVLDPHSPLGLLGYLASGRSVLVSCQVVGSSWLESSCSYCSSPVCCSGRTLSGMLIMTWNSEELMLVPGGGAMFAGAYSWHLTRTSARFRRSSCVNRVKCAAVPHRVSTVFVAARQKEVFARKSWVGLLGNLQCSGDIMEALRVKGPPTSYPAGCQGHRGRDLIALTPPSGPYLRGDLRDCLC
jgi:hypothetical protein